MNGENTGRQIDLILTNGGQPINSPLDPRPNLFSLASLGNHRTGDKGIGKGSLATSSPNDPTTRVLE